MKQLCLYKAWTSLRRQMVAHPVPGVFFWGLCLLRKLFKLLSVCCLQEVHSKVAAFAVVIASGCIRRQLFWRHKKCMWQAVIAFFVNFFGYPQTLGTSLYSYVFWRHHICPTALNVSTFCPKVCWQRRKGTSENQVRKRRLSKKEVKSRSKAFIGQIRTKM